MTRYHLILGIAKILDFGFATFYSQDILLNTNCGSPCYAAPEIYESKSYQGPEVDVWSLGVILILLTLGVFIRYDNRIITF